MSDGVSSLDPKVCFLRTCIFVSVVDFFNRINLLYGTVCENCTEQVCPTMSGGPRSVFLVFFCVCVCVAGQLFSDWSVFCMAVWPSIWLWEGYVTAPCWAQSTFSFLASFHLFQSDHRESLCWWLKCSHQVAEMHNDLSYSLSIMWHDCGCYLFFSSSLMPVHSLKVLNGVN